MHPLDLYKYCPRCGSSHFVINNFKSKKCEECGFTCYFNASASTAAFITDKAGRLLVARRAKEPAKGTLDLPGGFIDLYESAEEALRREIKEETELEIADPEYLFSLPNIYSYSGMNIHTVDLFYRCETNDATSVHAADDVEELYWIDRNQIKPELFGLTSIRKAIEIWLVPA
jgi:NADH pyrophosphatase NudC (nudix superfamily)